MMLSPCVMQLPEVTATVNVMIAGIPVSKKLSVPKGTLDALANSAENGAYLDANSGVHERLGILSTVAYPSDADLATLCAIVTNTTHNLQFSVLILNSSRSNAQLAGRVVACVRYKPRRSKRLGLRAQLDAHSCP